MTSRDVPFDEEVEERDPETQECFAEAMSLDEVHAMQRRFSAAFDAAVAESILPSQPLAPGLHDLGVVDIDWRKVFGR